MTKKLFLRIVPVIGMGCFLFVLALRAAAEPFTFAAIGCVPYSRVPNFDGRAENLRDEINRRGPLFTVHLGDIIAGNEPANDERFRWIRDWFDTFDHPLIFTPGDNEWTDAHRPAIGGYEPVERLEKLREEFFAEEKSRGRTQMTLLTQRQMPQYAKYLENARWEHGGIVFATLHVVGSRNNNQPGIPGAVEEFRARDEANIFWMRAAFAEAKAAERLGIVLFFHAQPFAHTHGREGYTPGFEAFLKALEEEAKEFSRPVLLIHADEHVYRYERGIPLVKGEAPLANLIRVGTFGDRDIHGVEVIVDPASPALFEVGPLIVPGDPLPRLRRR